jgi:hypothetical protein
MRIKFLDKIHAKRGTEVHSAVVNPEKLVSIGNDHGAVQPALFRVGLWSRRQFLLDTDCDFKGEPDETVSERYY